MPSSPELGNTFGNIGVIEVLNKVKTKHLTKTNGHIRITGEIKVDIEQVKKYVKYTKKYKHVSDDILNILSRTIGYKHFQDFCEYLSSSGIKDSELSCGEHYIKADDLDVGDRIYIAWLPDRECSLKYLGNYRFEVDENPIKPLRERTNDNTEVGRTPGASTACSL